MTSPPKQWKILTSEKLGKVFIIRKRICQIQSETLFLLNLKHSVRLIGI